MIDGGHGEGGVPGEQDEFEVTPPQLEAPVEIQTELERPTLEDIPELLELWKQQYDFHRGIDPNFYVPYTDELKAKIEDYLRRIIQSDDPGILVAKEDTKMVGFITFGHGEEDYFDTNITNYGVLKEVLVDEEARGRGVARKLVDAGEEHFRQQGLPDSMVQCSAYNPGALQLYEKLGYKQRQILLYKNLYTESGEDIIGDRVAGEQQALAEQGGFSAAEQAARTIAEAAEVVKEAKARLTPEVLGAIKDELIAALERAGIEVHTDDIWKGDIAIHFENGSRAETIMKDEIARLGIDEWFSVSRGKVGSYSPSEFPNDAITTYACRLEDIN